MVDPGTPGSELGGDSPPPLESPRFLAPTECPLCKRVVPRNNYLVHSVRCSSGYIKPEPVAASATPSCPSAAAAAAPSSVASPADAPGTAARPSQRIPAEVVVINSDDENEEDHQVSGASNDGFVGHAHQQAPVSLPPQLVTQPPWPSAPPAAPPATVHGGGGAEESIRAADDTLVEQLVDPGLELLAKLAALDPDLVDRCVANFTRGQLESVPGLVRLFIEALRARYLPIHLHEAIHLRLAQLGFLELTVAEFHYLLVRHQGRLQHQLRHLEHPPVAQQQRPQFLPQDLFAAASSATAGQDSDSDDSDVVIDESRSTAPPPRRLPWLQQPQIPRAVASSEIPPPLQQQQEQPQPQQQQLPGPAAAATNGMALCGSKRRHPDDSVEAKADDALEQGKGSLGENKQDSHQEPSSKRQRQ